MLCSMLLFVEIGSGACQLYHVPRTFDKTQRGAALICPECGVASAVEASLTGPRFRHMQACTSLADPGNTIIRPIWLQANRH